MDRTGQSNATRPQPPAKLLQNSCKTPSGRPLDHVGERQKTPLSHTPLTHTSSRVAASVAIRSKPPSVRKRLATALAIVVVLVVRREASGAVSRGTSRQKLQGATPRNWTRHSHGAEPRIARDLMMTWPEAALAMTPRTCVVPRADVGAAASHRTLPRVSNDLELRIQDALSMHIHGPYADQ